MTDKPRTPRPTILLLEPEIIVRFALAEYLRACKVTVIEVGTAEDAKTVLIAGPHVHVLMSDAQLAGDGSGFAIAQWVRRHRPSVEVIMSASLAHKSQAAQDYCSRDPDYPALSDASGLRSRIQGMVAARKRRLGPTRSDASSAAKRKHR